MNTKIIKFDLNKKLYEKIVAKQGDTKSRFLLFNLLDGSIPFDLTNRSVRVYGIKRDGTEIFNDLIVNNATKGYCTLELTNQMLALSGEVELELMIIEGDKKLTSNIFTLEVRKSINSEKAIVSTNEFTALLNGLASLSEYDNYKNEIKDARGGKAKLKDRLDNFEAQLEKKINLIPYNVLSKETKNNYYGKKLIYVLGDSISYGLNVIDRTKDSYLSILRNCLNIELGSTNIGFEGVNVGTTMTNYHNLSKSGTWSFRNSDNNMGLQVIESSVSGSTLTFTPTVPQKNCRIVYDRQENGGSVDIYINDVKKTSLDTSGTQAYDLAFGNFSEVDEIKSIKLVKIDDKITTFGGIIYFDDEENFNCYPIVKSGHKLISTSDNLISRACEGSVLFMNLGHNDRASLDNLSEFTRKINLIIQKCNELGTYVVVSDFIWYETTTDIKFKNELKRLATETNGLYIGFDFLPKTYSELEAIGFLSGNDTSHPTIKGHRIIGEEICRNIGLSITGKYISQNYLELLKPKTEELIQWTKILDTDLTSPFTNSYTSDNYISKYMKIGKTVYVFLQLNTNSAGSGAAIFTLPAGYRPMTVLNFIASVSTSTKDINQISVSEGGKITWNPTSTIFGTLKINFSFNTL